MPVYSRQLKEGIRFRYVGYKYSSPSIYQTKEEAQRAEQEYLETHKDNSLQTLVDQYEIQPSLKRILGEAYTENGQLQKALEMYRKALEDI